ncbi:hypothetical protein SNEBB_007879, partial [Seison nebaliae]
EIEFSQDGRYVNTLTTSPVNQLENSIENIFKNEFYESSDDETDEDEKHKENTEQIIDMKRKTEIPEYLKKYPKH